MKWRLPRLRLFFRHSQSVNEPFCLNTLKGEKEYADELSVLERM
jgi:hypothetical protein